MNNLNPKVWKDMNRLHEEIREKLLQIAKIFLKDIETPIRLKQVLFTGSLASYQWRPTSDFDLHLVVDVLDEECLDTVEDYFESKSKIFNTDHEIFIKGYKVEVNIKTKESILEGKGIYDLLEKKWIQFPQKPDRMMEDPQVLKIVEKIKQEIAAAVNNNAGIETLKDIRNKIKTLRTEGLKEDGEYSVGNLVFKKLRHDQAIKKLYDYKKEVLNKSLSLESFKFRR
jgi:predicted nucleotidyltransferase